MWTGLPTAPSRFRCKTGTRPRSSWWVPALPTRERSMCVAHGAALTLSPCDPVRAQLQFDATTGASGVLLTEETEVWIQLNDLFTALPADFVPPGATTSESKGEEGQDSSTVHFLWGSERTGFACLYLYAAPATPGGAARLVTQVTSGEFNVEAVNHVDASTARVRHPARAACVGVVVARLATGVWRWIHVVWWVCLRCVDVRDCDTMPNRCSSRVHRAAAPRLVATPT